MNKQNQFIPIKGIFTCNYYGPPQWIQTEVIQIIDPVSYKDKTTADIFCIVMSTNSRDSVPFKVDNLDD